MLKMETWWVMFGVVMKTLQKELLNNNAQFINTNIDTYYNLLVIICHSIQVGYITN